MAGKTDFSHVLNVLPEDLWRLILANVVQNVSDYLRLCGASLGFRNLLISQRVPLFLTSVVKILLRQRESWEWTPDPWDAQDISDDPRINLKSFAVCRQVSSDWKKSIQRVLHNLPYHYQFTEEFDKLDYQFSHHVFQRYTQVFKNLTDFTEFENYFHESHFPTGTNPFLTRAVEIHLQFYRQDEPEFLLFCLDVLRKYGKHVWHLTISVDLGHWPTTDRLLNFGHFLKDVLNAVPNLRSLRHNTRNSLQFYDPLDSLVFPPLKNLVFLDLHVLPLSFVKAHLRSAKPTHVGITFLTETGCDSVKKLAAFGQACSSVSKLKLDLHDERASWNGIISGLETHFGDTLKSLLISLPGTGNSIRELQLPHLKELNLNLKKAVPLDFLLGTTKNLQDVAIKFKDSRICSEIIRREGELKVYKAIQDAQLFKSNIWELFLNLSKFKVSKGEMYCSVMMCTRREYILNLQNSTVEKGTNTSVGNNSETPVAPLFIGVNPSTPDTPRLTAAVDSRAVEDESSTAMKSTTEECSHTDSEHKKCCSVT